MDNKTGVVDSTVCPFLEGFYEQLLESSLSYFFRSVQVRRLSAAAAASTVLRFVNSGTKEVQFDWMNFRYLLLPEHVLSEHEYRLLKSMGTVLSTRYELVSSQSGAMRSTQFFVECRKIGTSPPLWTLQLTRALRQAASRIG